MDCRQRQRWNRQRLYKPGERQNTLVSIGRPRHERRGGNRQAGWGGREGIVGGETNLGGRSVFSCEGEQEGEAPRIVGREDEQGKARSKLLSPIHTDPPPPPIPSRRQQLGLPRSVSGVSSPRSPDPQIHRLSRSKSPSRSFPPQIQSEPVADRTSLLPGPCPQPSLHLTSHSLPLAFPQLLLLCATPDCPLRLAFSGHPSHDSTRLADDSLTASC